MFDLPPIDDAPPGIRHPENPARSTSGTPSGLVARGFREVTLLYADLANVSRLAARTDPAEVVRVLDGLFLAFDRAAERHGLARVAVAGEALAAVAGLGDPGQDHARAAAEMALEVTAAARQAGRGGARPSVRVGLHAGPVVAAFDRSGAVREVWGESARVARQMESQGLPGFIQVSAAAARRLEGRYRLESRPGVRALTAGQSTWFLTGRLAA